MAALYRFIAMVHIMIFMSVKIVWWSIFRIFTKKTTQRKWLDSNVVLWANLVLKRIDLELKPINTELLKSVNWNRNIFIIANHQSYADIPVIIAGTNRIFGFIAKYELGYIPFLRYWMQVIGCVFINRAKVVSAIRSLKTLEEQGQSCRLTIFPEGTRSKNGKLGPFKTGGLKIAWQLDAILVPAIITGSRTAWENRNNKRPFHSTIQFHPPIDLAEVKKETQFNAFISEFEENFKTLHQS